jgi:hypothetical protein
MNRLQRRAKNIALHLINPIEYDDEENDLANLLVDANDLEDLDQQNNLSTDEENDTNDDDILPVEQLENLTSDGQSSDESDEEGVAHQEGVVHTAKNGLQWRSEPLLNASGRVTEPNIIHEHPGPKCGVHPQCEKEAFLMFTDEIINEMVRFTNLHGRREVRGLNSSTVGHRKVWVEVSRKEMDAFIGINLILGAYKAHYRNINELFTARDGHPICRATMSKERFCLIKRMFRMDDKRRRDTANLLAPMGRVVDLFKSHLQRYYVANTHITIDEQLMEFHGRVRFRQYIASKPGNDKSTRT